MERKGVVLASPIAFTQQAVKAKGPLDSSEFSNPNSLQNLRVIHKAHESQIDSEISFQDFSPLHPEVKTQYQIEILRKGGFLGTSWKTLAKEIFSRPEANQVTLSFGQKFKISKEDIKKYAKSGQNLKIKITTKRQAARLNNGRPLLIEKEEIIQIQ